MSISMCSFFQIPSCALTARLCRHYTRTNVRSLLTIPRIPSLRGHYLLLLTLYTRKICCYLTGGFIYYLVGIFNSYRAMSLFVALTNVDLLDILFSTRIDHIHAIRHR
jgi:hypothetical protein